MKNPVALTFLVLAFNILGIVALRSGLGRLE